MPDWMTIRKICLGRESYVYEKDCSYFGAAACKCRLRYADSEKMCLFCRRDGRNEISDFFTAVVQYVKGNVTYTKTAYLGFAGGMQDDFWRKKIPVRVTMSVEPVGRPENVVRAAVEAAVNKGKHYE